MPGKQLIGQADIYTNKISSTLSDFHAVIAAIDSEFTVDNQAALFDMQGHTLGYR